MHRIASAKLLQRYVASNSATRPHRRRPAPPAHIEEERAMSNEALDPLLRQFAEKQLGRALAAAEEKVLLERLSRRAADPHAPAAGPGSQPARQSPASNPPAPPLKTRQEVREQIKHFLQLNQQKAYEKMRGILQSIDAQNEATLGVLATEQRKVAGMLDTREPVDGPPAANPPSGAADIQDSTRQALMLIGEQLTGLIKQEMEACFRQYVDPLSERVLAIHEWLQNLDACLKEPDATAPAPAPAASPDIASPPVHDTSGQASLK
ncbi:hypothetical protein [Burkholderia sp. F1]|uniref:hypothetical protein n=1 Tax=Burkholderia sp. F1 TaxID=3366817 RepID=UPI003D764590